MQLNRDQLKEQITEHDLISNIKDLDRQLTPNGFDLSLQAVHRFMGPGQLDFTNEQRELPETEPIRPDEDWWDLESGVYKIIANEIVDIPTDLVGIGFPRSSLMRMGAHIQNAFWEAGYRGETECLLCVDNPEGIRLKKDARILQISFHELQSVETGYRGRYGDET